MTASFWHCIFLELIARLTGKTGFLNAMNLLYKRFNSSRCALLACTNVALTQAKRKLSVGLCLLIWTLVGCTSTDHTPNTAVPTSSAQTSTLHVSRPQDAPYQALLAQYQRSLRVGAVLTAADLLPAWQLYPKTSFYQPHSGRLYVDIQAMQTAMVKQQPELCLRLAEIVLGSHWLELEAHFAAAVCADELGQARKAAQHRSILNLLLSQITQSGDGKSAATAYLVLSSAQARSYVQLNGFDVIEQALLHQDQRFYDRLRIKSMETGRELEVYFDVTWQMQWVAERQDDAS
jgi:hypothetical protein